TRQFQKDFTMMAVRRWIGCGKTVVIFALVHGCLVLSVTKVLAADVAAPENKSNDKKAEPAKTNPYLPKKGMSVDDLKAYIERMQEAPETIRNRPGFAEGMAVAAQRILDSDPQGSLRTFAVTQLLDALHQWADLDESQEADKQLAE